MNALESAGSYRTKTGVMPDDIYAEIVEAAPIALVAATRDGQIEIINGEAERLFGYSRDELIGKQVELLVPEHLRIRHAALRELYVLHPQTRAMGGGRPLNARRKDGAYVAVEVALKSLEIGADSYVLAVVVDVTQRERLQRRFETALEAAPIAMLTLDIAGRIVMVNREVEMLYGYGRDELVGRSVEMLVPARLRANDPQMLARFFSSTVVQRLGSARRDFFGLRKDGSEFPVAIGLSTIPGELGSIKVVTIVDVTEQKRWEAVIQQSSEELEERVRERTAELARANHDKELLLAALEAKRMELERLSREDSLTGLANRRAFGERLREEVRRAERLGTELTLAMLDIDHFKLVNDTFGHAIGDDVLQEVAQLMRHECRAIDVIARYGGEEFALMLPGTNLRAGVVLCERIRRAFCAFDWNRLAPGLAVRISAGLSAWSNGLQVQSLLAEADQNLYAAKRSGRNCVVPALADADRTVSGVPALEAERHDNRETS